MSVFLPVSNVDELSYLSIYSGVKKSETTCQDTSVLH